uniref:Uncharacterized protein LOC112838773 n=1 Tax=Callorhinus ursinus TaxID=34884 RepID=A0A3Q7S1Y4_CALUR|nr:uncharacterized protein LOC112838773 [Callorhinus ursinus]
MQTDGQLHRAVHTYKQAGQCPGPSLLLALLPSSGARWDRSTPASVASFFSVFCLAASPVPFLPPGSSLSCQGPGSASSPRSPWPASASGSDSSLPTALLPPLLSDQAQHVHALGTFHLFCQATGPADVHFVWEKNGRELETCVPTQTHTLLDGRTHVLSWLQDTTRESAEYRCSVLSSTGNKTSRAWVTVRRHEATHQEQWTRELAAWRAVVGEHDRMMRSWRKAWVCGQANRGRGWQSSSAAHMPEARALSKGQHPLLQAVNVTLSWPSLTSPRSTVPPRATCLSDVRHPTQPIAPHSVLKANALHWFPARAQWRRSVLLSPG